MHAMTVTRRSILLASVAAPVAAAFPRAIAQEGPDLSAMKPGQYIWTPERAAAGPVVVLVSIPDQRVTVYRSGALIGASTCSTGKPGHTTPAGVFVILQKDKNHHSSTYNNAPMPFMERLTWQGVALHAGNLPGYPASHGCIRLPLEFAKLLFGVTTLGTPVIVADAKTATSDIRHPGLLISDHLDDMARAAVQQTAAKSHHPEHATTETHEAAAFVISTADKKLLAFVNGKEVFASPVGLKAPEKSYGNHAFTLTGPDSDPRHMKWMAIGLDAAHAGQSDQIVASTLNKVDLPPEAAKRVLALMHPGSTMVITSGPATAEHRSDPGFTIMTHDDA